MAVRHLPLFLGFEISRQRQASRTQRADLQKVASRLAVTSVRSSTSDEI